MLCGWEGNHACLKVTQPTVVFYDLRYVSCGMTATVTDEHQIQPAEYVFV